MQPNHQQPQTIHSDLPERDPRIGEMVRVRLACADDDAQGQGLEVFWNCELDRAILDDELGSNLRERGFDPPDQCAAFLNILRWSCTTATDPSLFQALFRAGIRIDAYQVEPLRKALRPRRVNLFIADDTGLGKTIEVDLIIRELVLHRVVTGRRRIDPEYALGSRRLDLLVFWPETGGRESRFVVECKVAREGGRPCVHGREGAGADRGSSGPVRSGRRHLVVFDMGAERTWADKVFRDERTHGDARITVWGV